MDGMTMLLKQFGFDPEVIKTQIVTFQTNLSATINHFEARFQSQEKLIATQSELITLQTLAIREMSDRLEALHGPGASLAVVKPIIEDSINGTIGSH